MKFLFIVALFLTSTFVSAQNIQFADANFKQYLLNFSSLDANLDQEISYEEALEGIYTLSGQQVKSGTNQAQVISLELTPGVYILKYQSGKNERLIVQ